jgi:integrase
MGSVYAKGDRLYLQYKDTAGKRLNRSSGFRVGEENDAKALLEEIERTVSAQTELGFTADSPATVAAYVNVWIESRKGLGLADWSNDKSRLELHVLPTIGDQLIAEVRPRHLVALFSAIRKKGKLAPKTIHHVYGTTKALFRDAVLADLAQTSPCILTKYQLGPNRDKDPSWRSTALYTRLEAQQLISDPRIPENRRIRYGLDVLAGLRLGEDCGLRIKSYLSDLKPLGQLKIVTSYDTGRTKTGAPRLVPVHPTLAAMLAEWLLSGWERMMGRPWTPEDLLVPMPPEDWERKRNKSGTVGMRDSTYSYKRLKRDLETLGIRHRRGHDMRRTFVSLARTDGARKDILSLITHNPGQSGSSIDLYTTFDWPTLCSEVEKLNVQRLDTSDSTKAIAINDPASTALLHSNDGERPSMPLALVRKDEQAADIMGNMPSHVSIRTAAALPSTPAASTIST